MNHTIGIEELDELLVNQLLDNYCIHQTPKTKTFYDYLELKIRQSIRTKRLKNFIRNQLIVNITLDLVRIQNTFSPILGEHYNILREFLSRCSITTRHSNGFELCLFGNELARKVLRDSDQNTLLNIHNSIKEKLLTTEYLSDIISEQTQQEFNASNFKNDLNKIIFPKEKQAELNETLDLYYRFLDSNILYQ